MEPKPGVSDLAYYEALSQEKLAHIEADDVVRAIAEKADALQVLQLVKAAVAREAASLGFQRAEGEKRGRDGAQTSSRRIDALLRVAHLELETLRLQRAVIDPHSEPVQKMAELWVADVTAVAEETLPPELLDVFLVRLEAQVEDWEDRAEALLR